MDDADRFVQAQEREMQRLLDGRRATAARHAAAMNEGIICMACGEEIPEARRKALPGCCLCFDCQEEADRSMGR